MTGNHKIHYQHDYSSWYETKIKFHVNFSLNLDGNVQLIALITLDYKLMQ